MSVRFQCRSHVTFTMVLAFWNKSSDCGFSTPIRQFPMDNTWLVVYLPLWKIWVRQLGLLFPIYGKIKFMFQTTNQTPVLFMWSFPNHRMLSSTDSSESWRFPSCRTSTFYIPTWHRKASVLSTRVPDGSLSQPLCSTRNAFKIKPPEAYLLGQPWSVLHMGEVLDTWRTWSWSTWSTENAPGSLEYLEIRYTKIMPVASMPWCKSSTYKSVWMTHDQQKKKHDHQPSEPSDKQITRTKKSSPTL